MQDGYTVHAVSYTYDPDVIDLYGDDILTLAETGYQQQTSLSGTVTIEGEAKIGVELMAKTDGMPEDAVPSYQWYRDDTKIDGATEQTYTPVAADAGKTLKVEVMAENYSGSVFSDPTSAIEKKMRQKLRQSSLRQRLQKHLYCYAQMMLGSTAWGQMVLGKNPILFQFNCQDGISDLCPCSGNRGYQGV